LTSSTTDLGQSQLDAPDFTLVAQAIFADDLEFGITVGAEVRMDISDMKHRQADAQWPGYDFFRRTDGQIRRVDEGPCRSWSRTAAP
jgi:hypothetical protein